MSVGRYNSKQILQVPTNLHNTGPINQSYLCLPKSSEEHSVKNFTIVARTVTLIRLAVFVLCLKRSSLLKQHPKYQAQSLLDWLQVGPG